MPSRFSRETLGDAPPFVLPSMLLCDFGHFADEIARLEEAGARALHLDVMDGHFVPNLTYGMPLVVAARRASKLPLDVHLMIQRPAQFLRPFADAGADTLTIHIEADGDPGETLLAIRALGLTAGLALNPPTPLERIEPYLEACDLVLVMSVMPGFGGQKFDRVALHKLSSLKQLCRSGQWLEVDGGITFDTVGDCAAAGAELLVAGSAIFVGTDYARAIEGLRQKAASAAASGRCDDL